MPHSGVQLLLDRSGQVTVFCGATEIGQGSDDVLAGIVAEVLGIDPFDVRCVTGDTGLTPIDLGSYSSRVTVMMGNAAIEAAEQRARACSRTPPPTQLQIAAGADRARAGPRVPSPTTRARACRSARRSCSPKRSSARSARSARTRRRKPPGRYKGGGVGPSPAYSYTACVVEVEVDEATGWIHVPKIWIAHDIGRALNPVLARGQVEGSRLHGAGRGADGGAGVPPPAAEALARARPQDAVDARVQEPRPRSTCRRSTRCWSRIPIPNCPFGAKEVGQGPLLPVMPAVANAIYDAVGVRIDELPITPGQGAEGARAKAEGREPARRARSVSRRALSGADDRAAAVGRRRRQRRRSARATSGPARRRRSRHDAPAVVPLRGAAIDRGGGAHPRRRRAGGDADRRRHRPAAQHEAPPAGAARCWSRCAASRR